MSLSSRQLAKLRQLNRIARELELRHAARRANIETERQYVATLKRKLELLPGTREATMRDRPPGKQTAEHFLAITARFDAEEKHLREELQSAVRAFEKLSEKLGPIVEVSAPMRQVIDAVRAHARLTEADAGMTFGAEGDRRRDVEVI